MRFEDGPSEAERLIRKAPEALGREESELLEAKRIGVSAVPAQSFSHKG